MSLFHTTRWSLIAATRGDTTQGRLALEALCRAYRPPVLDFIRHSGCHNSADAEDLTQTFFLRFIEQGWYVSADPVRGRFRSLLITALRRFLIDQYDMANARKRGQGLVVTDEDAYEHAGTAAESPDKVFARAWMANVLARAAARLEVEWERRGKAEQFHQLETLLLERAEANEVRALADSTGMRPNTLTVQLHRMRQRLRQLVRQELMQTVGSDEALEAELAELRSLLDDA